MLRPLATLTLAKDIALTAHQAPYDPEPVVHKVVIGREHSPVLDQTSRVVRMGLPHHCHFRQPAGQLQTHVQQSCLHFTQELQSSLPYYRGIALVLQNYNTLPMCYNFKLSITSTECPHSCYSTGLHITVKYKTSIKKVYKSNQK